MQTRNIVKALEAYEQLNEEFLWPNTKYLIKFLLMIKMMLKKGQTTGCYLVSKERVIKWETRKNLKNVKQQKFLKCLKGLLVLFNEIFKVHNETNIKCM